MILTSHYKDLIKQDELEIMETQDRLNLTRNTKEMKECQMIINLNLEHIRVLKQLI